MIEQAIKAHLLAHTGLMALLADSSAVWFIDAPQGQAASYITFTIFNPEPNETMGGSVTPTEAVLQVSAYVQDANQLPLITAQLNDCLARYGGTVEGVVIQHIFAKGFGQDYDEDEAMYERTHEFQLFYEE
jgi:hypothetical protein